MATDSVDKLHQLLEHHYKHYVEDHGNVVPFIDIYVNEEKRFQVAFFQFNFTGDSDSKRKEKFRTYIESKPDLTYSEEMGTPHGIFEEEWDDTLLYTHLENALQALGFEINEITHAVENDCPTEVGDTSWDDVITGEDQTPAAETSSVGDPRRAIKRLYDRLEQMQEEADGVVPDPFPTVQFYVDGEVLPYTVGPNVHSLENFTEDEQAAFEEVVAEYSNLESGEVSDTSISIPHQNWTPDEALAITETVLSDVFEVSIQDISYAEITSSSPDDPVAWDVV